MIRLGVQRELVEVENQTLHVLHVVIRLAAYLPEIIVRHIDHPQIWHRSIEIAEHIPRKSVEIVSGENEHLGTVRQMLEGLRVGESRIRAVDDVLMTTVVTRLLTVATILELRATVGPRRLRGLETVPILVGARRLLVVATGRCYQRDQHQPRGCTQHFRDPLHFCPAENNEKYIRVKEKLCLSRLPSSTARR